MTQPEIGGPKESLFRRAARGSAITGGAYVIGQMMRLASNLILTRLLVPEAFGLMTLVSVVLVGMVMFSDVGVAASISQHKRGDDPAFLNTAYTIHAFRGAMLWLVTCALAVPLARLYSAPELSQLLPVAGLSLLIAGFNPTRIDTATRHLLLGRVTVLDLASQVVSITSMVTLALIFGSVWALVVGALLGALSRVFMMDAFLPGDRNRFHWEPAAAHDLIHFGKWIFLSTACGFLLAQGDKTIFGYALSLNELGIYNIGFFLGSFPLLLARSVNGRIMIPLYRDHHPASSRQDFLRMRRLRWLLSGGTVVLLGVLALIGPWLVHLLYDPRYAAAGPILVAVALIQMPEAIAITYDQSALAAGNSKGFFALQALRAFGQTLALILGVQAGGLAGALLAQGLVLFSLHPAAIVLARWHRCWDVMNDLPLFALAAAFVAAACWTYGLGLGLH